MKKVTLLLFAIILATVSCSDKKNGPDPEVIESGAVPMKIVMTSKGEIRTYTISYLDNTKKIDKITGTDGWLEKYTYDGDFIVKKSNGTGTSEHYDSYVYIDGKLTKESQYRGSENTDIVEYTYSGAATQVSFKENNNNTWEEALKIQLNYDGKENFTSATLSQGGATAGAISITYDNKSAPFKNVLGWKKIRPLVGAPLGDNIGFEDIMGSGNNPVKLTGNMMGETVEVNYTYEFKDSANPAFPTKITGLKKVGTGSETFIAEIIYK